MFKRKSTKNVEAARARVAKEAEKLSSKAVKEVGVARARVAKEASNAGSRVVKEATTAGSRVAKEAGIASALVAKEATTASSRVAKEAGVAGARIAKEAGVAAEKVKGGETKAKAAASPKRVKIKVPRRSAKQRAGTEAVMKAQLAKTSKELQHESSDLREAVDSLNKVIKANRKAGAKSRTRLFVGVVLGAALTYHLDAEHGSERRQATARRLTSLLNAG